MKTILGFLWGAAFVAFVWLSAGERFYFILPAFLLGFAAVMVFIAWLVDNAGDLWKM